MVVQGFHHTSFTVSDMERSLAFYRDLLGMQVVVDRITSDTYLSEITGFPNVRLHIVYLRLDVPDGHVLELVEYQSHPGQAERLQTNNPGVGHLCFVVDDLPALYEQLRTAGTTFVSPPIEITSGVNKGGYAVYLRDPDGSPLELLQPPPKTAA
ncbi:MAG: hypothetical protein CL878_10640 [Dehalococcoidia bacterium]|nr:hypothetical protein [Dehalococcoidia bacterium]